MGFLIVATWQSILKHMNIESGGVAEKVPKPNTEASHTEEDLVKASGSGSIYVSENDTSLNKKIKDLKEEIKEKTVQQKRVSNLQQVYNVPDEALVESDLEAKNTSIKSLESKLISLQQQKKQQISPWRKTLRKVAAFFNF